MLFRHRVFGKPWKTLELFGFPQISMIYDVDFPVDFLRKKNPDDGLWLSIQSKLVIVNLVIVNLAYSELFLFSQFIL